MPTIPKISALIITYNEIGYIEKCLSSLLFADEIVVVDSYSTDGTFEYLKTCKKVNAIQHHFENYTAQKSFALEQASHDWILFLDADEVIPKCLKNEILSTLGNTNENVAFWFYRQFMFKNKKLRFSGWQTDKNYRLFRKSKVKFSDKKLVHETLIVNGSSGFLQEKLVHYCYKNYEDYKGKMLRYGNLKAQEAIQSKESFSYGALILKPAWKFIYHYLLRLGFLDGTKGLVICYLNSLGDLEKYRVLKKLQRKN